MTGSERRWVLVASLVVLLFSSLPALYAWSIADRDHVFTGFVYNTEDGNSYLGKMRQGADGAWLFTLFYTPEAHRPALVYTFYLLLGKLAHVAGLSLVLTYHLARLGCGLLLLFTVYGFAARFTPDVTLRRLAWSLAALGSGLGWLLLLLGRSSWLGTFALDFWVAEAFLFLVLFSLPHLALAEALLLWSLMWLLDAIEGERDTPAIKAGLAAAGMTLILPFYAGVLAAAVGAFLIARLIAERHVPWRPLGKAALVGVCVLPLVVYNGWLVTTNTVFKQWMAQNTILSPHPFHYLLAYGLLLIPAVPAMVQAARGRDRRWLLPLAWVAVVPVLLYIPFNLQRRMIAAFQIPLALLAARGLLLIVKGRTRARHLVFVAWVALLSLSNVLLVAGSFVEVSRRAAPIFRSGAETAAADWLAARAAPGEIVLTSFESGNYLPTRSGVRVFYGHGPETLYHDQKQAELLRFFDPATPDAWRQDLLARYALDYVFWGPHERALGAWSPAGVPYLRLVYEAGGYAIYQVAGEAPR